MELAREIIGLSESQEAALLSAIVVTYRQECYLYETIKSILNQTYPLIELVIADDGTDGLDLDSLARYIEDSKNSNLVSYHIIMNEINVGTVKNENGALRNAHGRYIKIIGGDDTYSSIHVFSNQVAALNNHPEWLAVVGKALQCDNEMVPVEDSRIDRSNRSIPEILRLNYDDARRYMSKKDIFPIAVQATCFRSDFFEQFGLCDERYKVLDDSPTVLRLLKCSPNVGYIDEYVVKHRSNVGVSSSRGLFAPRRIIYYEDCVLYARNEIKANPKVYGRIRSFESPRVNSFVLDMACHNRDHDSSLPRVITCLKYLDAIMYYGLTNTRKLFNRLKLAMRSEGE